MKRYKIKKSDTVNKRIEGVFTALEKDQVETEAKLLGLPRCEYIRRRVMKMSLPRWKLRVMRHVAYYSQSLAHHFGRICRALENCPTDQSVPAVAIYTQLDRLAGKTDKLISLVETYLEINR